MQSWSCSPWSGSVFACICLLDAASDGGWSRAPGRWAAAAGVRGGRSDGDWASGGWRDGSAVHQFLLLGRLGEGAVLGCAFLGCDKGLIESFILRFTSSFVLSFILSFIEHYIEVHIELHTNLHIELHVELHIELHIELLIELHIELDIELQCARTVGRVIHCKLD